MTADFTAYSDCQRAVSDAYRDPVGWSRMAARNIARVGGFSSDRTVSEYARDIWKVEPLDIELAPYEPSGLPPVMRS